MSLNYTTHIEPLETDGLTDAAIADVLRGVTNRDLALSAAIFKKGIK